MPSQQRTGAPVAGMAGHSPPRGVGPLSLPHNAPSGGISRRKGHLALQSREEEPRVASRENREREACAAARATATSVGKQGGHTDTSPGRGSPPPPPARVLNAAATQQWRVSLRSVSGPFTGSAARSQGRGTRPQGCCCLSPPWGGGGRGRHLRAGSEVLWHAAGERSCAHVLGAKLEASPTPAQAAAGTSKREPPGPTAAGLPGPGAERSDRAALLWLPRWAARRTGRWAGQRSRAEPAG